MPNDSPVFVSPSTERPDLFDSDDDPDAPHRYRMMDELLGTRKGVPLQPDEDLEEEVPHLMAGEEPDNFDESAPHEQWWRAMMDELQVIRGNNTWTLVDLPHGEKPIGRKWVFKLKKDAAGTIVKHKARLVAKEYVQRPGVDFEEVFALVAHLESVRVLLATATHRGCEVHNMDMKSAFLNGVPEEVVYVAQPPGFARRGEEEKVYKLQKALYGLRQAPRTWNSKLDGSLASLGFTRSRTEHAVYMRGTGAS